MAPFLGRIIAQIVVPVIAVLARALPAAYSAAVHNAKKNGVQAAKDPFTKARMSRSEAFQIMNLTEQDATAEVIQKVRFFVPWDVGCMCVFYHSNHWILCQTKTQISRSNMKSTSKPMQ